MEIFSTTNPKPKRGEIWHVTLDPTLGAEMKKSRPVVVISSDALGKLPLRLVAPVTTWKDTFENNVWHVKLQANRTTGLTKQSAVDALQARSVSLVRFERRLGRVSAEELDEIIAALIIVVEGG